MTVNILTIKDKINHLKNTYSANRNVVNTPVRFHPVRFHNDIILKYTQKVLTELEIIINDDRQNNDVLIKSLKSFLNTNWDLVKGSLLSYTALPNHEITELLCDIAEFVANKEKVFVINLLMPNIRCDSLFVDKYPNLDSLNVRDVIKSYILSKDCNFLVPVCLLTKEDILNVNKLPNVYYDYETAESLPYLTNEDLELLLLHSPETMTIRNARNQHQVILEDKETLLGQINILTKALYINSVKGIGQEDDAGSNVYAAIQIFNEYWLNLPKNISTTVPNKVLTEIKYLLALASPDTNKKRNHIDMLETCLATRREELQYAVTGNEEVLDGICLTTDQKEIRIEKTKKTFQEALKNLRTSLNNNAYLGHEKRSITTKILRDLNITLAVQNLHELIDILRGIQAKEVDAMFMITGVPEKIAKVIASTEDLIELSIEVSDETLRSVLYGIKDISLSFLKFANFKFFLTALSGNQCAMVCEALKDHLASIIKNRDDFLDFIQHLTHEKHTIFLETLKDHLPSIIKNGQDFRRVLTYLTDEHRTTFFEAQKDHLPSIIKDSFDFNDVITYLTDEQCTTFFKTLKDHLPSIIKVSYDFKFVLENLTKEQRTFVFEALKDHLPSIINTGQDFRRVLTYLTDEHRMTFFETQKDHLPSIIKDSFDFNDVITYLTDEQCTTFFKTLKDHLPSITKVNYDFQFVLENLTKEQRTIVFEALKDHFPSIIKNSYQFNGLLKYITDEQRTIVFEALKDHLPSFINDAYDFIWVLENLTDGQRAIIFEAQKDHLSSLIKNAADLIRVLQKLTNKECAIVCETIKDELASIIKSDSDFVKIITNLTLEQRPTLCEILLKKDLIAIQQWMDNKEKISFFESSESNILDHLKHVLSNLKQWVNKDFWNTKRINFFRRPEPPSGIRKLRKILNNEDLNAFEKLNNLHEVITKKCETYSFCRREITHSFYKELLASLHFTLFDKNNLIKTYLERDVFALTGKLKEDTNESLCI